MSSGTDPDDERDAHLREALRHAPDADAAPPSAVSQAILRQARLATAPAPTPAPTSRGSLGSLLSSWMGLPVAAGFASLMVATLVGVMWWERPIDEPLTEARAPAAPAPAPAPAPRELEVAAVAPPSAAPPLVSKDRPLTPPAPMKNDAAARKSAAAEATRLPAESKTSPQQRAPAPALRDEKTTRVAPPLAESTTVAAAAPPAPDATGAASPRAARQRQPEVAADSAGADTEALLSKPAPARPAAAAGPGRSSVQNPVAGLRAALAARPEEWTWQRGNGAEQPMNEAVQTWLGRVDDATRTRWQTTASEGRARDTRPLRLLRNGRLQATLHLEAGSVRVETAGQAPPGPEGGDASAPSAALPGATAAELKATLEQAAP